MVYPINSLMNMEYSLYGGTSGNGYNVNCPSYSNGYMGANSYMYPYAMGYNPAFQAMNNNADVFTQSQQNLSAANNTAENGQVAFGASPEDLDILGKYYIKGQAPSEGIRGAAVGGAAFSLLTNLRFIAHPWNSLSTMGKTEKLFKDVKVEGSNLNKLWKNPETHRLMTDAYARMHKLEGAAKSRLGLLTEAYARMNKLEGAAKSRLALFKSQLDPHVYNQLKSQMENALRSGDKQLIAEATERIRMVTDAKTGLIPRMFGRGKDVGQLIQSDVSAKVAKNISEKGTSLTLGKSLRHEFKGAGGIGGALMMGMEFFMDKDKISAAFAQDKSTGMKQLGQTTVKGAGSLVGWTAGQAVGAWAGAKLGATLGTAISPGLGTVIGAVAGLIGGSIGCCLMGKLTHKIVGEDVGSKVQVNNMKKSAQGQVQLLQLTAMQAQGDKQLDPKVAQALQNVANVYST